ncbi:MAG: BlaI/MecI/CopY family transcriptional regulator [Bacteroidetes bacterium]|nr:MAG: BlaI/MecI/CopY family transcriptional regulator [Bacteroidota bacterium]
MSQPDPSEAELEILQILWEHEPATVRFVHEHLSSKKEVGYTTTLKQMQRMTEKQLIRQHKTGKSHEFTALVRQNQIKGNLYRRLVDGVFQGSAMGLVLHALGQDEPSPEELAALEQWLAEKKKGAGS